MEEGSSFLAYEIKSATVFHDSFFRNLAYLRGIYGNDVRRSQVIYDGLQESDANVDGYMNFRHIIQ